MTGIDELQSRISQYGVTRPNRFQVEMTPPPKVIDLLPPLFAERLAIQCETVQLPGKSFSTQPHRIYGPIRKFPYTPTFTSSIDLAFRIGTDYKERSVFDLWQNVVMNQSTNMFGYYEDYVVDFVIHQFNEADERIYSVKLFEVWPEAILPVELSAESRDTYNRQTITFAFRYWAETNEVPLTFTSTVSQKKAEDGKIITVLKQSAFAFFDQLPRITGSGGTLFGSIL